MNPETKDTEVQDTETKLLEPLPEDGAEDAKRSENAEPVETEETAENVEPVEKAEPEKPAESVKAVQIEKPAETVEDVKPAAAVESKGSTEPARSTEVVQRKEPARSAEPVQSREPAKSTETEATSRPPQSVRPAANPKPAAYTPPEELPEPEPEKKKRKLFWPIRFFFRHFFVHLWLLLDLAGLGYFYCYHEDREKMNALAVNYTRPFQAKLGQWCSRTSLSVMEILTVALVFLVIAFLFWSVISILADKGRRLHRLYSNLMTAVCFTGFLAAAAALLWGTNFWTDNFQDQSGLKAQPVSTEDLQAVTTYFARALSYVSTSVERDEAGRFAVKREDILADAPTVYDNAEASFPCLVFDDVGVKAMTFSRLMSAMDFTGFYCAYTGEANVNVDSPACLLPANAAHEMAHQRGFASEQECNFLAVLASVTSANPAYVYSGYLMGYIYLGNALYAADPDAYWSIRQRLPESVVADLAQNNTYWDQFRDTKIQEVSNQVYDKMLKTYGDERGMQSYGDMVDLLVAYWLPALQAAGETA